MAELKTKPTQRSVKDFIGAIEDEQLRKDCRTVSPLAGFAPRKQNLTLYIMSGFKKYDALLKKLGKHEIGKSCLYIKRLDDVDMDVLTQLIEDSVAHVRKSNA